MFGSIVHLALSHTIFVDMISTSFLTSSFSKLLILPVTRRQDKPRATLCFSSFSSFSSHSLNFIPHFYPFLCFVVVLDLLSLKTHSLRTSFFLSLFFVFCFYWFLFFAFFPFHAVFSLCPLSISVSFCPPSLFFL